MAERSKLDSQLFLEYFPRWKEAKKHEAGEIRRELERITGLSKPTLIRKYNAWIAGQSLYDIAENRTKHRVTPAKELEKEHRKKVAVVISALQRASQKGRKEQTDGIESAMRIAVASGHLTEEDLPGHPSTVARWLKEFGLSKKDFRNSQKQNRAAVQMDYKYAGFSCSVDATVANKVLFNFSKGTFEKRPDHIPKGSNHEADYLEQKNLSKVWIYYLKDDYSGAFWLKAYIPTKSESAKYGGENSADMRDFLTECFLPKENLIIHDDVYSVFGSDADHLKNAPMNGLYTVLNSDKGSPCNKNLKPFLERLGISVMTRDSKNPRANSAESLISAAKRVIEIKLNYLSDRQIGSIDMLNYILQATAYHHCMAGGMYQKYVQSSLKNPIRTVSLSNIRDALVEHRPRVVNNWGRVSVAWDRTTGSQEYCVGRQSDNVLPGTKVHVFRDTEGNVAAQDLETLKVYKCEPAESRVVEFGDYRPNTNTEADELRKVVNIESVKIKRTLDVTHIVPELGKVFSFKGKSEPTETSSILPPEFFGSVDEAKEYIVMASGIGFDAMPEKLRNAVEHSLESILTATGHIESGFVMLCVNKIREENILNRKIGGL